MPLGKTLLPVCLCTITLCPRSTEAHREATDLDVSTFTQTDGTLHSKLFPHGTFSTPGLFSKVKAHIPLH